MLEFLTSLISSTLANLAVLPFSSKGNTHKDKIKQSGDPAVGVNYGTVHQTTNLYDPRKEVYKFRDRDNEFIKRNSRVLFVDDQNQAQTIRNLKNKFGWRNVEQLSLDEVHNTSCAQYRDADLLFIDYDGLGSRKQGQGLSILSSLRAVYGRQKYYLLYTAHPKKITLDRLAENGLPIKDYVGWSLLTKGGPDYLMETTMLDGLRQVEL